MAEELLRTVRLRKEFGGLVAVDDVDFTVPSGSIVSLIGPNGAGKTTFFNMLTGVYKPTGGLVHFDGQDMTGKPPHAFTQRGIGRTFQNIRLFQNMTALENVLVGMHVRLKGNLFEAIVRTPRVRTEEREARERARELLAYSGLVRKDTEIGRVRPGFRADLAVVNGNPLENLKVLFPTGVEDIKDGKPVHTGDQLGTHLVPS